MGNTDKLANPVMELKSTAKSLQRPANMDGARLHAENANRQRAEQVARYSLRLFHLETNLAGNVNQLGFELGSRVPTIKPFATCSRNGRSITKPFATLRTPAAQLHRRRVQERSTDSSIMNPQPGTYVAAGSWSTTSSAQEIEHNFTIIGAAAHRKDPLIFYTMNPKSRTYIASGSSVITSLAPWVEHNFTGSAVAASAKMNAKLGANGDPNFIGMAAASIKMNAKVVLEKSNEHLLSMGGDGGFSFVQWMRDLCTQRSIL